VNISTLPPWQASDIGWLFGDAFHDEPLAQWLVPDPLRRRTAMAAFFTLLAEQAIPGRCVDVGADRGRLVAAALWSDRSPDQTPPGAAAARVLAALGEDAAARWDVADAAMSAAHPGDPHVHLMLIGVDPHRQRQGIASDLLIHRLDYVTGAGQAAYLEATTKEATHLYRRFGFEDLTPFTIPDGGPELYPMWRPAR